MGKIGKNKFTASNSDKHVLYQKAVQNPDYDAEFVHKFFKRYRKRPARLLREDFCGTFIFCCEWVKLHEKNRAIGVDLHKPTLAWGRKNNLTQLSAKQQERIQIENENVLHVKTPPVDLITAFNFSYFLFKTRPQLKAYFQSAYDSLDDDGMLILDAFGGSESLLEQEERRECEGFTYVWEHAFYNPLTSEMKCKIHFEFDDGSELRNAYVYDWRLWNLAEIRELLDEVGFKTVDIYWEGTEEETGEGNGVFRKTTKGEACQSWIAYLMALK